MDEALEYDAIVWNDWKFLYKDWPIIDKVKHHRTEIAAVNDIESIKMFVLNRLGVIPVFFLHILKMAQLQKEKDLEIYRMDLELRLGKGLTERFSPTRNQHSPSQSQPPSPNRNTNCQE